MIDFVLEFVHAHVALVAVASGSVLLLTFAAVFSTLVYSVKVYLGVLPMLAGGGVLLFSFAQANARQLWIVFGICAVWGGFTYFAGYVISVATRLKAKEKKEKRNEYRALQVALPERENRYVRTRLESVLHAGEKDVDGVWKTEFAYARSLLAKLKAAELSTVDRLQVDELGRLLAVYGKKEKLSASDLPLINDAFAIILKMSAKYGVNP